MPRTKEDNEIIQAQRREDILKAGLRVFSEKGLTAARIGDIAREAGISQGLLYHYFSSKEEVYGAIIAHAYDRMSEAALGLEALPLKAEEKIGKALRELLRSIETGETFAASVLLIAQASSSRAVPEDVSRMAGEKGVIPYRVMERIFARGQEEGAVPAGRKEDLAVLFWSIIKGLALQKASLGEKYVSPDARLLLPAFLRQVQE